ncbi:extracellular solute-binding protein [Rhizobium sp. EC-SD404]|uniref:extracellular solute-binding protein n=1 Tax=Rhizobium sp. EC-SD404 TaxID=2038389 RepID=UPI00125B821A|nr:extracellular solute-binding protein [Rhizobium sp. EC-SD404]VVT08988.1 putative binding protein component of ABC transporter [Rhizobium sp. EC-SD404]
MTAAPSSSPSSPFRKAIFLSLLAATALAGAAPLAVQPAYAQSQELNALVWCDHTDPELVQPFEEEHDVRVNLREYEGTAAGLAILDQSQPGDWDVLVIDAVDVGRAVDLGIMAALPADELPTGDFFPELVMEDLNARDGTTYAVTEKFGYNTIAYNKAAVDPADMTNFENLFSGKYDGRIAIYDYYLPVLGMLSLSEGIDTGDLDAEALETLREPLFDLRARSSQVSEVVASQTALATGEVDILVGGGEWLTAVLAGENADLDWTIPEQGGVLWAQSIGVLESSENKDLATEFVKYIVSPEGQARLATSSCYWGMPSNAAAGDVLTDEEKTVLRWDDQADFLTRVQRYPVSDAELDTAMQDLWTDMLQQ